MDGSARQDFGGLTSMSMPDRPDAPKSVRPRTVLIGNETLLVACAQLLQDRHHEIVAVVAGKGPAADWARRSGLRLFDQASDLLTADLGMVDYLFSITNLSVLSSAVLAMARLGAINFHDGPLPAYAGLNTPVWALLAGEVRHGITWHLMTQAVDGGAILASETIEIEAGESAVSLNMKCFEAGLRSFGRIAADIDLHVRQAIPQASAPDQLFGRRDRPAAAAVIDWRASALEIARLVSALDFGSHHNPLSRPKTMLDGLALAIQQVEILASKSGEEPGTLIENGPDCIVATGSQDLRILRIADLHGTPVNRLNALPGAKFLMLDEEHRRTLGEMDAAAGCYEGWWRKRLAARDPLQLPQFRTPALKTQASPIIQDRILPCGWSGRDILAAFTAYLARVSDRDTVELTYSDPVHQARLEGVQDWFLPHLPMHLRIDWSLPLATHKESVMRELCALHKRIGVGRDLIGRSPELRGGDAPDYPIAVQMVRSLEDAQPVPAAALAVAIREDGSACRWSFDADRLHPADVDDLWLGLVAMLEAAKAEPDCVLGLLPLLSPAERTCVVDEWNATTAPLSPPPLSESEAVHRLFVEQAMRTPDRTAVTSRGRSLTYAELDARSNQMARYLAERGVGPDVLVGIYLERSVDVVIALLATHKAGGAYVPLDPAYPRDRLAHMIEDSGLTVVVTQGALAEDVPPSQATIICMDEERARFDAMPATPFDGGAAPHDLAYVIYTSGSTGKPKGVMVEHRNVLNFFAGMDRKLEPEGVWLAVTSLSFDISVLELCWPLTRGYHVVIATDREVRGDVPAPVADRPVDFSLFYFASADGASGANQYRLLLEGARFADTHGFAAVWTPERHFHEFGGLYPNPSVTSAAIAAVTSRIGIRAGSVVAPLHHPLRIAEEWAVVDNLSNGRVGIAFASGWQPDDFVLNTGAFADKQGALMRSVADVRALWRGEARSFPGPLGKDVALSVYPRPVQPELPFWITTAGNPASFAAAGHAGASILTHLLGQSVEEVAEKIAIYREARAQAGHAGEGHVTLMLHSFVGKDAETVRAIVRQPLIDYLRTSTSLLKQYAWSFPAFKRPPGSEAIEQIDLADLSPEETDALLDHAFERYFETSGLFGTVEDCARLVEQLRGVGVNEIGCLIDFGIDTDRTLDSLPLLNKVRQRVSDTTGVQEMSLPDLIARHGVTHLQCTPSLAQMLTADQASRRQLGGLRRMMVGGEAFPPQLADDLTTLVGGSVMNMYGPTETTIWSAVHQLESGKDAPPLGRPLANQQIHILDRRLQLVRPGTPGELVIGGAGVVRGYLGRPELTAERFVVDPVLAEGRAYRTGDLARQRADGTLEFLGRLDHQVKIRGYRIELGEIEAALADHPQVSEVVVIARGEGAVTRLVAYLAAKGPAAPDADMLRDHLRCGLPDFMVPAAFVTLSALPRTPNGKIDRAALPAVDIHAAPLPVAEHGDDSSIEPTSPMQAQILSIWQDLLQVPNIRPGDNFFDIGGHSLLAVQLHRRLCALVDLPIGLTDIFRFPTVATLSAHLSGSSDQPAAAQEGQDRARDRRAALQRRSATRILLRN
ncbi:MupA/Atu3671 family FMN-dependent luciferase-like monooxygenase [Sphingobium aromaticiconvertens]|uniref:MupA/Atu3671 family FMN-dependent luciferase-like monooxygenase n=1 Tax=Sphingobium aromaticiconvertens TaxID=365341 RepID=UPI0030169612